MTTEPIRTNPIKTDVAIIGAGPVGLFAVFECGMLGLRTEVIDALDMRGGQCAALYPDKPIYDIPGYPVIEAAELIERLTAQAAPFQPSYHLGQQVTGLEPLPDGGWRLTGAAGTVIEATAVIIAAGVGAFGPNRPPLPGIGDYEGRSVFYFVAAKEQFRDKRVVIAGGGDSALDWAIALTEVAASVTVVHRRAKFRGAPASVAKMNALVEAGKIELAVPYQLHRLEGQDGQISAVELVDLDGATRSVPADALLCFFGLAMTLGPIADWGLALDHNHITVDPATCQTNLPGVFAIGDIARYPGKLKLILTGFAESAVAAHAIHPLARPGEALHFEYSTTKGLPGAS